MVVYQCIVFPVRNLRTTPFAPLTQNQPQSWHSSSATPAWLTEAGCNSTDDEWNTEFPAELPLKQLGNIICAFGRSADRHPDSRLLLGHLWAKLWRHITSPSSLWIPQLSLGRWKQLCGPGETVHVSNSALPCFVPEGNITWGHLWWRGKPPSTFILFAVQGHFCASRRQRKLLSFTDGHIN